MMGDTTTVGRSGAAPAGAGRIVALDGLRGIAAIIVLMLHFDDLSGVRGVFEHAYLAVDFFFMLSGFVLVPLIEHSAAGQAPLRTMAARVARLWPLLAIGVMIGCVGHALAWGIAPVLPLIPLALLFVPRLQGDAMTYPLNQPQWSLAVELAANAAHLLVLRRLGSKALLTLSALCFIVMLPLELRVGSLQFGSIGNDWIEGYLRAGYAYPLGIVLGRHCLDQGRAVAPAWCTRWCLSPALLIAALLLPAVPGLPDSLTDPVAILLFPAVLYCGSVAEVPETVAPRMMWLGGISYPLYATHFTILETAHVIGDDFDVSVRGPLLMAALGFSLWLAHVLARSPLARGIRLPPARPRQLQPAA